MTNMRWTGRVVKHLSNDETTIHYGAAENKELLNDYYKPLAVTAALEDDGKTVRQVLERYFAVSSKLLAQARLTEYGLTINEERVYISAPVQAGEVVRLRMQREQSDDIMPQEMLLSIIYEDDYLLVVNKPAGQVVHPTHGHYTNTLANGVVHYWQAKGERFRFRPIHRLDEETSGIVVIAKNGYIHQQLSEQMQQGGMDKQYVAFVYGLPYPAEELIDAPIDRDPLQPHKRTVIEGGYEARTAYKVLQAYPYEQPLSSESSQQQELMERGISNVPYVSLVRLKLYTGRTHQIRVHMSAIGHPLIGDKFYSHNNQCIPEAEQRLQRHALHAERMSFMHPMTNEIMEWTAPLPEDMEQLQKWLERGME